MGKPGRKVIVNWIHRLTKQTRRTESSKYPEEKKSIEIPLVAASERGPAEQPATVEWSGKADDTRW